MKSSPLALVILDGFGYSPDYESNAIAQAKKPTIDYLLANYPHTLLEASGSAVGLPAGTIGNSEVGHATLGAGRIIPSAFLQLHSQIASGEFFTNPVLISHLDKLAASGKTLHIMGLLSDAGVQCHQELIFALIEAASTHKVKKVVVHAFLDGRDVAPKSAAVYLQELQDFIRDRPHTSLGSICGRYYAMDRDRNWDRTDSAYKMLTQKSEPAFENWQNALANYYAKNITDEFIPPTLLIKNAIIEDGDGVIFANFREDRARQLTECFIYRPPLRDAPKGAPQGERPEKRISAHGEKDSQSPSGTIEASNLKNQPTLAFFISAIRYDIHFKNPVLLSITPVKNTLKEILSKAGKTIFTIAETEKYAHVTYFFADGREAPFPHETRTMIPSLRLKNYIAHPEMSAQKITGAVIASLQTNPCDFYLINYANADMVGHSGDLPATIKAVQCLDMQIKQLYDVLVKKMNGTLIITADHGNAEEKYDKKTGQPHTAHTTNKVPFIFIKNGPGETKMNLTLTGLADVAPFILRQMKLPFTQ